MSIEASHNSPETVDNAGTSQRLAPVNLTTSRSVIIPTMEQNKKEFDIITNQPYMLQQTIDWYNSIYKTDFELARFVRDEINFATIVYEKASDFDVFQLGANYGRQCEAFDKTFSSSIPPDYFNDKTKYPKE